jgi:hypothetical protein
MRGSKAKRKAFLVVKISKDWYACPQSISKAGVTEIPFLK